MRADALVSHAAGAVAAARLGQRRGRVCEVVGTVVEAEGIAAPLGSLCHIGSVRDGAAAEVVGFRPGGLLLMPYEELLGVAPGDPVLHRPGHDGIPVGPALLGRVVDAMGRPLDGGPAPACSSRIPRQGNAPSPMSRQRVLRPQRTGVKAIDAFVPCARGQRLGIFAGSGVGKSVLLGMISRQSDADINVVALVGERGREVREFLEDDLGPEGLARSVVVVATGDQSPVLRTRAAETAMAIAEWFRDRDHNVMLMMDSVTRYAMAQREIGLATGEPPTTRGYTPSVFASLGRLLERAGTSSVNAMTAFFTVLVEGDDFNEPVGDAVRSIVDGHILLDRDLARKGQFPAVDVMGSVSRLMSKVADAGHQEDARRVLRMLKLVEENEDLVSIGAYRRGGNPELDRALERREAIEAFLRQSPGESIDFGELRARLGELAAG